MNSNVFVGNLGTLAGVYRTPAIHADVTAVFTHTNPVRPYRGNGRPECAYVIERIVDAAAKELGIAPAEIRRRNIIPAEAMPFKSGLTFTYDSGDFAATLSDAQRIADVAGFAARRAEAQTRGKLRGIGLSNTIERAAAPGFEAAEVRFDRSGSVTLLSGSITQGQGHETIYKQILFDRARSGLTKCNTSKATPTRSPSAKAPVARGRRRSAARPSSPSATRSSAKAKRSRPR